MEMEDAPKNRFQVFIWRKVVVVGGGYVYGNVNVEGGALSIGLEIYKGAIKLTSLQAIII